MESERYPRHENIPPSEEERVSTLAKAKTADILPCSASPIFPTSRTDELSKNRDYKIFLRTMDYGGEKEKKKCRIPPLNND